MAALEVVHRRLNSIWLGPFCLELHSAKAKKSEVLTQLGKALDAGNARTVKDWELALGKWGATAAFLVVGMPCCGAWAVLGVALRGLLQDRSRLRAFNWAMALALVASMAPMARDLFQDGLF